MPVGALIGVLGLGIWAIVKVRRWRDEAEHDGSLSPVEQLDQYEKLVEEGVLDEHEFTLIKAQLEAMIYPPLDIDETPPPSSQPPDSSIRE